MILIIKILQRYQFYYPTEYKLPNNIIPFFGIISKSIKKFSMYTNIEMHIFDYTIIYNVSVETCSLVIKERDAGNTKFLKGQPCTRASIQP